MPSSSTAPRLLRKRTKQQALANAGLAKVNLKSLSASKVPSETTSQPANPIKALAIGIATERSIESLI